MRNSTQMPLNFTNFEKKGTFSKIFRGAASDIQTLFSSEMGPNSGGLKKFIFAILKTFFVRLFSFDWKPNKWVNQDNKNKS